MELRRVVTTHTEQGLSVVRIDEVNQGEPHVQVWTTDTNPPNNLDERDGGFRDRVLGGTSFRVGELPPGRRGEMHRTKTIDYCVVMQGEVDMEMDSGEVVHLNTGDVLVQRGTMHAWVNNGSVPARVAWILIDAEPITIVGKVFPPTR